MNQLKNKIYVIMGACFLFQGSLHSHEIHQYNYYYSNSLVSETTPQDKSTPSSDASSQNVQNQGEAKLDNKSTPSTDATVDEKKGKKEGEKKDSNKKEKEDEKKDEKKEDEKPKSPHTFTGNVSFVSDYRFRGISQTMRRPAIQGGFDYSHITGFYLGTWGSNVDGTTHFYNNTSMEWDFYGGIKCKPYPCLMPCFAYNIGLIYYYYPGGKAFNSHNTRYDTLEYYLELTYDWLTVKYSQTITNYFGINSDNTAFNWHNNTADSSNGSSRGSIYIEASGTYDLCKNIWYGCYKAGKLNILAHIGHQFVRHYHHLSYTDWRVTLTQEFEWLNVFVSYVGTEANHHYYDVPDNAFHLRTRRLGEHGAVIGVIKSF